MTKSDYLDMLRSFYRGTLGLEDETIETLIQYNVRLTFSGVN